MTALTVLALPLRPYFLPVNVIMLYLLLVTYVARYLRRGPAVLASALAVAAFDFFFVEPLHTFAVSDAQYVITFAVMLSVGILISGLTGQLEEEVEARAATQSEVANEQLRNSLLSSISHDLRTPLAGISGAASTLLSLPEAQLAESAPTLLTTIRDESDRLELLVNNILDMTRLESGTVQLNLEWLPLEEPVGAALNELEALAAGRRIDVRIPGDLPLVYGDAVLLERLFANLLANALKYTPAGSPIDVIATASDGRIEVRLADHGPGIGADGVDLFAKLGRAGRHGSTSDTRSAGAGLGLSICKAIAEAHGGSISAANRSGGGALFTLTLPLSAEQPQVPAEPVQPSVEAA